MRENDPVRSENAEREFMGEGKGEGERRKKGTKAESERECKK